MKRISYLILIFILIIGVTLVGCASTPVPSSAPAQTSSPTGASSPTTKLAALPATLVIGTTQAGGDDYNIATLLANVITTKTSIKTTIQSQPGPTVSIALMSKGTLDLTGTTVFDLQAAYKGLYGYNEPTQGKGYKGLRLLFLDAEKNVAVIAPLSTGIKTTKDLKGKNMALVGLVAASPHFTAIGFAANGGLTEKDVNWIPVESTAEMKKVLVEGKADAGTTTLGAGFVEEIAAARNGVRFASMDPSPEAMKRMNQYAPGQAKLVKTGTSAGVVEDTYFFIFRNGVAAFDNISDDVAYTLVKTVWDNIDTYRPGNLLLKAGLTTEKDMCTSAATIPFHPGAIKFFKEKGVWTPEMEALNQSLLAGK